MYLLEVLERFSVPLSLGEGVIGKQRLKKRDKEH